MLLSQIGPTAAHNTPPSLAIDPRQAADVGSDQGRESDTGDQEVSLGVGDECLSVLRDIAP